jgi:hypothetical protein
MLQNCNLQPFYSLMRIEDYGTLRKSYHLDSSWVAPNARTCPKMFAMSSSLHTLLGGHRFGSKFVEESAEVALLAWKSNPSL